MYEEIGKRIGGIVDKKQSQYGDVFSKAPVILAALYPNGISTDQYRDVLAVVRVLDKIGRIATGNQGDENAWNDIAGYGLLMSKE